MLKVYDYEKTSVVELVNDILIDVLTYNTSSIYFHMMEHDYHVDILINGTYITYTTIPYEISENVIRRIKMISGINPLNINSEQSGMIKATFEKNNIDFIVSTIPDDNGEQIKIKIVNHK